MALKSTLANNRIRLLFGYIIYEHHFHPKRREEGYQFLNPQWV